MASTDNPLGINLAPITNQVGAAGSPVIESNPPMPPSWQTIYTVGTPSTPPVARGSLQNSYIAFSNNNLYHACDFKLNFGLGSLTFGASSLFGTPGDNNPLVKLYGSIFAFGALLRTSFNSVINALRTELLSIIASLGFDPSGVFSELISSAKHILSIIAYYTNQIKRLIQDAALIIAIVGLVEQIIQYLLSLPARILAFVKGCITGFLQSVENIPNQLSGIASGTTQQVLNQIQLTANQAKVTLSSVSSLANVPPSMIGYLDPSSGQITSVADVQNSIGAITASANTLLNSTQSALSANTSGP
jgi:hypothetical protein